MGLKTSIGKGTRVRHSTGLEWDKLEKAKKKHTQIIHSTGEGSKIRHSTGMEMDFRALYGEPEDDETETNQETRLHSIPAKAGEDTKYLDLHVRSRRKGIIVQSRVTDGEQETGMEDAKKASRDIDKNQFRTISIEY